MQELKIHLFSKNSHVFLNVLTLLGSDVKLKSFSFVINYDFFLRKFTELRPDNPMISLTNTSDIIEFYILFARQLPALFAKTCIITASNRQNVRPKARLIRNSNLKFEEKNHTRRFYRLCKCSDNRRDSMTVFCQKSNINISQPRVPSLC